MRGRTLVYTGVVITIALLVGTAGLLRFGSRPALAEAVAPGTRPMMPDSVAIDSTKKEVVSDTPPPARAGAVGEKPPFGELPLVMKGQFPDARVDLALIAPPSPIFLNAVQGLPLTPVPLPAGGSAGGAFLPIPLGLPLLLGGPGDRRKEMPLPPAVVPEPAPLVLLGTGLLLLLAAAHERLRGAA